MKTKLIVFAFVIVVGAMLFVRYGDGIARPLPPAPELVYALPTPVSAVENPEVNSSTSQANTLSYFDETADSICSFVNESEKAFCIELWFQQKSDGSWSVFLKTYDATGEASVSLEGMIAVPVAFTYVQVPFETIDGKWQRDIPDYLGLGRSDFESVILYFNPKLNGVTCQRQEMLDQLKLQLYCVQFK